MTEDAPAKTDDEFDDVIIPSWRQESAGEQRWPVALVLLIIIAIELVLPQTLLTYPRWVSASIEIALLVALLLANPGHIRNSGRILRTSGLVLVGLLTIGNVHQAIRLISGIIGGTDEFSAGELFAAGAGVWITNVVVFALWYWELDRGGPSARAAATHKYPDFMFPQMDTRHDNYPPTWAPRFWDYLYIAFTNATAFSPTDAMPMTRWAKMAMMLQSAISLSIVTFVFARAIGLFA